jgi:hypothetical protein
MSANSNQFVTWATAAGANIPASPATYAAMTIRQQGAQVGIADPISFNNAMRQASVVATMVAQFIADLGSSNVNDDGNVATLEAQFIVALQALIAENLPAPPAGFLGPYYGTDSGSADAILVTNLSPAITSYVAGQLFLINVAHTNLTTSPKFQISGRSQLTITRADGTPCVAGDIKAGADVLFANMGSSIQLVGVYTQPASLGPYYGSDTGAANALVVTTSQSIASLAAGLVVLVHNFKATNTSATPTLNVDGFGAKTIVLSDNSAAAAGQIVAGGDAFFEYDGTNWRMYSMLPLSFLDGRYPEITLPPSGAQFYVNASTGNDSNAGLSPSVPFLTIQGAINAISTKYLSVSGVTINVSDGAYAGFTINQSFIGNWTIIGNVGSPGNVSISSPTSGTNGGYGITGAGANVSLSGASISSVYSNVQANSGSNYRLYNINLTAPTNTSFSSINAYNLSSVFMWGTFSVSGSCGALLNAGLNSSIQLGYNDGVGGTQPITISFTGGPTYSNTAFSQEGSTISIISSVTTFSGSVNGARYLAILNGIINTGGGGASYIPGSTSGSTATGGQYA